MRIISGIYKSRVLRTPSKSAHVRPTTDRARETLFNILNNRIDFDGLVCADLFCGTGSFGLECISRGAEKCYFVDVNTELVRKNISLLKAEEKSHVIKRDASVYLGGDISNEDIDIAFADPPYNYTGYDKLVEGAYRNRLFFILEHSENYSAPKDKKEFITLEKKIGISGFTFFDFKTQDEKNNSSLPGNI